MQVRVVSFQKHKRLSVVQFLTGRQNTFGYISGPRAINEKLITVKEVSEAGSVNNLLIMNKSDQHVFFMDGDILTGAKQNRVLNTSVLIAPNTETNLPVSCVEQGRWRSVSGSFGAADYISPQKLRANKSIAVDENLRSASSHSAKQSEVWDDVMSYCFTFGFSSPTQNLLDVFESKKEDFEEYVKYFPVSLDANGVAVFTDKNLLSVDVFNRTDIFREYFPKILRSTGMEVSQLKDIVNEITETEAVFKTVNLFDNLDELNYSVHPGVGVGSEKRYKTNELTGLELSFEDHLIHLSLLNIGKQS